MKHFWDQIKNSNMFNFQEVYRMLVARCSPGGTIVEVGSWVGQSLAFLLVEAHNASKGIRVVSVDAFLGNAHGGAEVKEQPQWETFRKNLAPVWPQVIAIKSLSVPAAAFFHDESVDSAFIDADHHYNAVVADLAAWWPKVKPGGILAGHDLQHEPVRKALDLFVQSRRLHYETSLNSWIVFKPADSSVLSQLLPAPK